MTDREKIAWLYRRAGFGLAAGQLEGLDRQGLDATVAAFVDPGANGVPPATDPWATIDFSSYDRNANQREFALKTIGGWLQAMVTTTRPFEEWMRWFWHGHFVSTLRVVKFPQLMVGQMRMFAEKGLGDFPSLLRAVTVDPAMLVYLDGVTSSKNEVNENYGREVLELFALGIGNYNEADVRAGAEALTGWRVARNAGRAEPTVSFEPRRHDDTPKAYLGRNGVHDVDTVVDAIVNHPACAPFITRKLAKAILGPDVDQGLLDRLSTDFAASGMQLRPLAKAVLEAGLHADASRELVLAPVPWLVSMIKATAAPPDRMATIGERGLVPAGQVPMDAPNVAGWPGGRTWLTSSSTVARFNMAASLATLTPADSSVRAAARSGDLDGLAEGLGRPEGFSTATASALAGLGGHDKSGDAVLTVAMAAPDLAMG
jgi:uncharacterized protein (DUF1800 family)